jgi:hypothetical protein
LFGEWVITVRIIWSHVLFLAHEIPPFPFGANARIEAWPMFGVEFFVGDQAGRRGCHDIDFPLCVYVNPSIRKSQLPQPHDTIDQVTVRVLTGQPRRNVVFEECLCHRHGQPRLFDAITVALGLQAMQVDDAAFEYQRRVKDAYQSVIGVLEFDGSFSDFFIRQSDQRSHEVDEQRTAIRSLVSHDGGVGCMVVRLRDVERPVQFCREDAGIVLCG